VITSYGVGVQHGKSRVEGQYKLREEALNAALNEARAKAEQDVAASSLPVILPAGADGVRPSRSNDIYDRDNERLRTVAPAKVFRK
jgi:hypothetical protein